MLTKVHLPRTMNKTCFEKGRLETFEDWPYQDSKKCSRLNMAQAGFSYLGHRDCVECFVCSVKLEEWDPDCDEPFEKHLEQSPECLFAQTQKQEALLTVHQVIEIMQHRSLNTVKQVYDEFYAQVKSIEENGTTMETSESTQQQTSQPKQPLSNGTNHYTKETATEKPKLRTTRSTSRRNTNEDRS